MQKLSFGAVAYAAYAAAVGGQTFDGKPLPVFDALGDPQKAGWAAAAMTGGFAHALGETITAKNGVRGTVTNQCNGKNDRRGYHVEALDTTGRPFEAWIEECDVVAK